MDKYVRITKTLNDKGRIIKKNDGETLKAIIAESPDTDWYRSLFYYDKAAVDYFEKHDGSIAGYSGKVYTDKLVFDLDCEKDVDKAKKDTSTLLFRLEDAGIDISKSAKISYSGNKGFYIEIPIAKELEPEELKSICTNIAAGLETFDSVVYNANRIFRIENTKHPKSGLYKIDLDPNDLLELSVDQIKERAKKPNENDFIPERVMNLSFLDKFKTPVKVTRQVVVDVEENGIRGLAEVDFTTCPPSKARCIHALEHGVMIAGQGQRNSVFLALARYYRNAGMNKEVAYNALKGIARNNARLYPECEPISKDEIWKTVINGTYGSRTFKQMPGAFGSDPENETLKFYCDASSKYTNKPCPLHNHVQQKATAIIQIHDVADGFGKFAEELDKNLVKTGYSFIDNNAMITTGTTTLIVGCSGSAKTTKSLNILEKANKDGISSMFFSCDMGKNMIYQKLAQKCTDYSRDEILALYTKKDKYKTDYIKEQISKSYGKTYFDFSKTLTLEQVRDRIFDTEQKTGEKIKFVLLDYVGRLSGPHSDRYANSSYNALKTVEMAEVTDAAWIMISQISRNTGLEMTPLRSKRVAKESGDWEDSCTTQVNMWRPFYGGGELDNVVRVFLAKSRMGQEVEEVLYFDGAKGIVRDMTPDEKFLYENERGKKAELEFYKQQMHRD